MIALLSLAAVSVLVLLCYTLSRRWLLRHRSAGDPLQTIHRPLTAEAQFWGAGLVVVVTLTVLVAWDPVVFRAGGWLLLLLFAPAAFEVACWASGVYQFAFYDKGLWYGRSWYSYADLQSSQIDRNRVVLLGRGRVLSFRTDGSLAPEIRLKLSV